MRKRKCASDVQAIAQTITTMAKLSLKLDKRVANKKGEYPIKFYLTHGNGKSAYISTGVSVYEHLFIGEHNKCVKSSCPNAALLNKQINQLYLTMSGRIFELGDKLERMSIQEVKDYILKGDLSKLTFIEFFEKYKNTKVGKTRETYEATLKLLMLYCNNDILEFQDVTFTFLNGFEQFLVERGNKMNTRAIHFRNIRAVFNNAIDNDVCTQELYPFRKFKIKQAKKEKEYLEVQLMRDLINLEIPANMPSLERCRDLFVLSFYLCGANPIDLYNMPPMDKSGTVKFIRTKIKYREPEHIKIKVQDEALAIIRKYSGTSRLLNLADVFETYEMFYNSIKMRVRKLGEMIGEPNLTMYWARYSWATYASKIGIDESVIGKALGHTDVSLAMSKYVSFDWSRVDEANRKVIDYLNS